MSELYPLISLPVPPLPLFVLTDALYQVSEKLEGPFNMELAADSISVKVSEAIMHMQENSVSISTKARNGAKADDGEMKGGKLDTGVLLLFNENRVAVLLPP